MSLLLMLLFFFADSDSEQSCIACKVAEQNYWAMLQVRVSEKSHRAELLRRIAEQSCRARTCIKWYCSYTYGLPNNAEHCMLPSILFTLCFRWPDMKWISKWHSILIIWPWKCSYILIRQMREGSKLLFQNSWKWDDESEKLSFT